MRVVAQFDLLDSSGRSRSSNRQRLPGARRLYERSSVSAVLHEYDYLISRATKHGDEKLVKELTQAREKFLEKATSPK